MSSSRDLLPWRTEQDPLDKLRISFNRRMRFLSLVVYIAFYMGTTFRNGRENRSRVF